MEYLFGIRFDKMYYPISDDARQDQEEMNKRLYEMEQSVMVSTSTANFETSSEPHIQSYSLEIAFRKLDQDRIENIVRLYNPTLKVYPLSRTAFIYAAHDQDRIADLALLDELAEVVEHSEVWTPSTSEDRRRTTKYHHDRTDACEERSWSCCAGFFRRRSRKLEYNPFCAHPFLDDVADNLRVEPSTIKSGEKDEVAVDLRIEPSTLKLGKALGTGSYSEVRVAEWVDCECAVKIMRASDVRALRREVGIMELRHPHIVQLVGFSANEDKCMILMELMDGDLQTHIASQTKVCIGNVQRKNTRSLEDHKEP